MAQWSVVLQPMVKLTANSDQEVRFALPSPPAKTILAWVTVSQNSTATTNPSLQIYGATSADLNPDLTLTVPFWLSQATIAITLGQTGTYTGTITNPAPFLRWRVSNITSGTLTMEITLICWDV